MNPIFENLPFELLNEIYSFVGKHKTAIMIEEYFAELEEEESCRNCGSYDGLKNKNDYDGLCEYCYVNENPHFDIGIGRNCNICNNELQMYRWCKIYGNTGGEYCLDCYNSLEEEEEE